MEGSTNGLLFLRNIHTKPDALYICNPITREYIDLPNPPRISEEDIVDPGQVSYGFGLSKKTDQYKVVQIFHECELEPTTCSLLSILKSECHVYTLGTGSWRSVPLGSSQEFYGWYNNVFLNGNMHWLVVDFKKSSLSISCFDLETELFKAFSPPPHLRKEEFTGDMAMLGDCLCFSDNASDDEIVIWVMKEYGVEKSWTKEIVIKREVPFSLPGHNWSARAVYPIKVFRDGDILLSWGMLILDYYSDESKKNSGVDIFEPKQFVLTEARPYVCSFLSLKSFAKERIAKF